MKKNSVDEAIRAYRQFLIDMRIERIEKILKNIKII